MFDTLAWHVKRQQWFPGKFAFAYRIAFGRESERNRKEMASLDYTNSQPNPCFAIRGTTDKFLRSISTKETPSFSQFAYSPPRLSNPAHHSFLSPPRPCIQSDVSTSPETTYRCVSSVLKKDGQILCIAVSNGLIYTGSDTNLIRLWKLPEFTECGQLKTKARMVVALEVSNDRVYAGYGDGKIRVWQRTWDRSFRHDRLATIPKSSGYVWSYIAGRDKRLKHVGPITSLAFNNSDDILYSASLDKTVKAWRISDLKCIETIQAHSQPVNSILVSDDGVLYTASDDSTVRAWQRNFGSGDRPHSLTVTLPTKNSPVKTLTLTTVNGVLYGGCSDGYVHYWLRARFSVLLQHGGALQGHTHAVMSLANVANYVISGSADSTCRVWARETDGQHICLAILVGHRGPIRCVAAFSVQSGEGNEDGCTICSGSLDGVLKMWRVMQKTKKDSDHLLQSGCEYFELQ